MIFTELRFAAFFVLVAGVTWALRANGARKLWLLLCSYAFYAAWDWRFLSLIVGSTLVDHLVGLRIHASDDARVRNRWLTLSLVANLGLLGVFKYLGFFVDSGVELLGWLGLDVGRPALDIVLPVGISFYTFQTMSYSIDIHARRLEPARSLLDLALFVGFFPQLVAGPIVRARAFLPQLASARRFADVDVRGCLVLFLVGFVKKAVVSDGIARSVDVYFAMPDVFDTGSTFLAVGLYAVQIYCDFSGYSDMAIATAGLLGYSLCLNFDFPYFASDIGSFWRRWHMSLSTWLRDYLFIPLSETRWLSRAPILALVITMLLGGLWHGADWRFVIWGGLHGFALLVHRGWVRATPSGWRRARWLAVGGTVLTLWWLGLTWVFFRAPDIATALYVAKHYLLFEAPGNVTLGDRMPWVLLGLAVLHALAWRRVLAGAWDRLPRWGFAVAYGSAASLVLTMVHPQAAPFIYFQF